MGKAYDQRFFDWVNFTAARSAHHVVSILITHIRPCNVLDIGCGQGAWLAAWRELGVIDVMGVDGGYVVQEALLIPPEQFLARDLAERFCLGRSFDLVQSLEVAEHLPPEASAGFVSSLCAHGDVVLFSAAQPGQGGEGHVNERSVSAWAREFAKHGYMPFDFVRPKIKSNRSVDPWYRYNTIVFANAQGASRLSPFARSCRVRDLAELDRAGNLGWKFRRALLRPWPPRMLTLLSRLRYRLAMTLAYASTSRFD
jgi:SAM-dependent methyltransferase